VSTAKFKKKLLNKGAPACFEFKNTKRICIPRHQSQMMDKET